MSVSINIVGISSVKAFLAAKGKEATERANDAIIKAGFFIEGEIVQSIAGRRAEPRSVDTGFFMGSILSVQPKLLTSDMDSNNYPVGYAPHLEFGTSRMRPRRHFKNTAKRNEKKVKDFIEKEIDKL